MLEQGSLTSTAGAGIGAYLHRQEFRRELAVFIFAFLLGSIVISGDIAPLGVAAVAAAWMARINPYYAMTGAILSALINQRYEAAVAIVIYVASCLVLKAWRKKLIAMDKLLMLCVAQLVVIPLFYMQSVERCMVGVANLAVCALAATVMRQGMAVARRYKLRRMLTNEEQLSIFALAGMLVMALARLTPFDVSLGAAAAVFICATAARAKGIGAAAAAVMMGAALIFGGGYDMLAIGNLALYTICASSVRKLGRFGCAAGFALCWLLISRYVPDGCYSIALPELIIGLSGAVALPKQADKRLAALMDENAVRESRAHSAVERLRCDTGERLERVKGVFAEVGELFSKQTTVPDEIQDKLGAMKGIAACVCDNCPTRLSCWRDADSAAVALAKFCEGGDVLPPPLSENCLRREQLKRTAAVVLSYFEDKLGERKKAVECLEFANRQLNGLCGVLDKLSGRISADVWYDDELEAKLMMRLDRELIRVRSVSALRMNDKLTLKVTLSELISPERVERCVSNMLGAKFRLQQQNDPYKLVLEEMYRYDVTCGVAKSPAPESKVSGDCISIRELGDGKLLLLLSDGMGTGVEAHRESAAAVALIGDLLSVGYDLRIALECANRLLIAKNNTEIYATLDAMLIDMQEGTAHFIKHGAPPSYIIRDKRVHTLYCEALPVGIVEDAQPALYHIRLERGDVIVLMTDGAYDSLGSALIATLIEKACIELPDESARAILQEAMSRGHGDDMSAMVVQIA